MASNWRVLGYGKPTGSRVRFGHPIIIILFVYVYSQTTAATTVQCTTSVQQIGQRQTESTNREAPLMQHMNNVTHPN